MTSRLASNTTLTKLSGTDGAETEQRTERAEDPEGAERGPRRSRGLRVFRTRELADLVSCHFALIKSLSKATWGRKVSSGSQFKSTQYVLQEVNGGGGEAGNAVAGVRRQGQWIHDTHHSCAVQNPQPRKRCHLPLRHLWLKINLKSSPAEMGNHTNACKTQQ